MRARLIWNLAPTPFILQNHQDNNATCQSGSIIISGAKPKWLFYEAGTLKAGLAADPSSTEIQNKSFIFR